MVKVAAVAKTARDLVLPPLDKTQAVLRDLRSEWVTHHGRVVRIIPTFVSKVEEQRGRLSRFRDLLQDLINFSPDISKFLKPLQPVERAARAFQQLDFSQHAQVAHNFLDELLGRSTAALDFLSRIDLDLGGKARSLVNKWNVGKNDADLKNW